MRKWLTVVTFGFAAMILAFIVSALVLFDKPHFQWMVGTWFLPIMTCGVIAGGLLIIVGTLLGPARKTWRGIVLIVWGLVAVTSPAFGFLFLAPWSLLVVTIPLVVWILATLRRTTAAAPPLPATQP